MIFNVGQVQEQGLIIHQLDTRSPVGVVEHSLDGMRGSYNQSLSHGDFVCVLDQQSSSYHNT